MFFELRAKSPQTFIIVTHDEHLAEIKDRTIHLEDGLIKVENVENVENVESVENVEKVDDTEKAC